MLTYEQYTARCALLRFQAAFLALKDEVQGLVPLEMFPDFQQMDAACRQFFDAANRNLFSKPAVPRLAKPSGAMPRKEEGIKG